MGEGSGAPREREIDTYTVSGARALRRAGWSDARIADAYGAMPPMHLTLDEILAQNARAGTETPSGRSSTMKASRATRKDRPAPACRAPPVSRETIDPASARRGLRAVDHVREPLEMRIACQEVRFVEPRRRQDNGIGRRELQDPAQMSGFQSDVRVERNDTPRHREGDHAMKQVF